jgi:hypothetical protein
MPETNNIHKLKCSIINLFDVLINIKATTEFEISKF